MTFVSPEWFLLIPAGLVAAWLWPRCRTRSPVRAVLLALLVVALAHPLLRRARPGLDLFVLVDRSASAAEALARSLPEWEGLIQKAKKPEDQLAFIDYGAAAQLRGTTGSGEVDPEESRTALAVRFALSQTRKDRLSRFLVLSDGYSTEPLQTALEHHLGCVGICLRAGVGCCMSDILLFSLQSVLHTCTMGALRIHSNSGPATLQVPVV